MFWPLLTIFTQDATILKSCVLLINSCKRIIGLNPLEEKLISGCLANNSASQNELYKHFAAKMFGVCLRYAKDRDEAADLLQEGFIKVFDNLPKFKKEGSFEGWIRRIMVNTALSNFRKKHHMYAIINIDDLEVKDESLEDDGDDLINQIEINEVLEIIKQLSPGYQMVLNLYAIEGFSHKEIAKQLGISENTSKSQLSRARLILQNKLKENITKKKLIKINEK